MNREGTKGRTKSPIRAIFDFRKEELPIATLMFLFFFIVIAVFTILRPLKKAYVIEHYGADPELYVRLFNIAVAALAVIIFTFLYNKLSRQGLIYIFGLFFAASFIALKFFLVKPNIVVAWWYYIQVDLITTIFVAAFWAYLTDISTSDQAKRLYGFIGLGGVVGGSIGATVPKLLFEKIGESGLLILSAGLIILLLFITSAVEFLLRRNKAFRRSKAESQTSREPDEKKSKMNAVIEGAKLALRSKYLAAIVGIMACYELGSQVLNYMISKTSEVLPGVSATTKFFIDVQWISNLVAVVLQLFLVSFIMRKFGLAVALCVLPVAAILSTGLFMALPSFTAASLMYITDNGINNSIHQTAREALYVPTSPDEKYKARAFTNMFVQRLGKGLAIGGTLLLIGIGVTVRFLSFLAVAAFVVMALLGIFDGRRFKEMTK